MNSEGHYISRDPVLNGAYSGRSLSKGKYHVSVMGTIDGLPIPINKLSLNVEIGKLPTWTPSYTENSRVNLLYAEI